MKDDANTNDRGLTRIIQFSSGLSLGLMAAFLFSLKQVTPELRCELSFGTWIAFAVGAVLSWALWRLAFNRGGADAASGAIPLLSKRGRRWVVVLGGVLILGTALPFAFALKDLAHSETVEVVQGLSVAVVTLVVVGLAFWRLTRFLEADSRKTTDAKPDGAPRQCPPGPPANQAQSSKLKG